MERHYPPTDPRERYRWFSTLYTARARLEPATIPSASMVDKDALWSPDKRFAEWFSGAWNTKPLQEA